MKPTFVMLVGLPYSGKKTIIESIKRESTIIVDVTKLREQMFGDILCDSYQNGKVFTTAFEIIKKELKKGNDVIFRASNISRKKRRSIINKQLKNIDCFKFCLYANTSYEACLQRLKDDERENKISPQTIHRMLGGICIPHINEGFDGISIVTYGEKEKKSEKAILIHLIDLKNG